MKPTQEILFVPLTFERLEDEWLDAIYMSVEQVPEDMADTWKAHHADLLTRINQLAAGVLSKHLASHGVALVIPDSLTGQLPPEPSPRILKDTALPETWGFVLGSESDDEDSPFDADGFDSAVEAREALIAELRQGHADRDDAEFLRVNSIHGGMERDDAHDAGWIARCVPCAMLDFLDEDNLRNWLDAWLPEIAAAESLVAEVVAELWPQVEHTAEAINFDIRNEYRWYEYREREDVWLDDYPCHVGPEPSRQQMVVGVGQGGQAKDLMQQVDDATSTLSGREALGVLASLPGAMVEGGYVATRYEVWRFAPDVLAYLVHYRYLRAA